MRKEIEIHGLKVSFDSVPESFEGDSMGDPSVPNGEIECPPYIDDLAVYTPDGYDITNEFSDLDRIEAYAIKEVLG